MSIVTEVLSHGQRPCPGASLDTAGAISLRTIQAKATHLQAVHPELYERISDAVSFLRHGCVEVLTDSLALVRDPADADSSYTVTETCPCRDARLWAPGGWCAHRLAVQTWHAIRAAWER